MGRRRWCSSASDGARFITGAGLPVDGGHGHVREDQRLSSPAKAGGKKVVVYGAFRLHRAAGM